MQYRESNFEIRKQYKLRFRGAARQMAPFRQLRASGTKLQAKTAVANRRRAARGPNLGNIVTTWNRLHWKSSLDSPTKIV